MERDYDYYKRERGYERDYERFEYRGHYRPAPAPYERYPYDSQATKRGEKAADRFETEDEEIAFIVKQERQFCPPVGLMVAPLAKAGKFWD